MHVHLRCKVPLHMDDQRAEQVAALGGRLVNGVWQVTQMTALPNRHPHPDESFLVLGKDLNRLLRRRFPLIGVAHSHLPHHLDGPSDHDLTHIRPGMLGGVYKAGQWWWYMARDAK